MSGKETFIPFLLDEKKNWTMSVRKLKLMNRGFDEVRNKISFYALKYCAEDLGHKKGWLKLHTTGALCNSRAASQPSAHYYSESLNRSRYYRNSETNFCLN